MTSRAEWGDVEGIIFDAVGTLIEPVPSVSQAYAAAALRQGVVVELDEVKRRFRLHFRNDEEDEQIGPMATDERIERRRWRRIVANVLPDLPDLDRGFDELWEHFGDPKAWRCFPDVGPTLAALREAGFPTRIASNFDGRLRGVAAGKPDLAGFVETVVISSEVGVRKPHPGFYLAACEGMGLAPNRVLCVGDDLENDVRGAERAGLRGILVDREGRRPVGLDAVSDLREIVASLVGDRVRA
ncbi:HAD-IA family hydrolase [Tundrisphaera sp. TA3]|uniref:HAD-IA family hydrolase n=1 Tax=Tundrisphaera sp. TA3 TaxID=3435775 RepID=UPI003EBEFB3F